MAEYVSQYPPAYNDTYVKATSIVNIDYSADRAANPALSLIGGWSLVSWICGYLVYTNQRFHIDLGSAKTIDRIYYENNHNSGANTNAGAKNFTLWGSNSAAAFADLVYSHDTDWTQIGGAFQFDQHVAANQADPKYIDVTGGGSYRYYALKIADDWGSTDYMGLRKIVLQSLLATTNYLTNYRGRKRTPGAVSV